MSAQEEFVKSYIAPDGKRVVVTRQIAQPRRPETLTCRHEWIDSGPDFVVCNVCGRERFVG